MMILKGYIGETLLMYQKMGIAFVIGAALIMMVFAAILFSDRIIKLWSVPRGLLLTSLLGISLALVMGVYYCFHERWGDSLGTHALLFLLLYGWCALGLWFFAGRHTSIAKLSAGLILQAIILYTLFRLT